MVVRATITTLAAFITLFVIFWAAAFLANGIVVGVTAAIREQPKNDPEIKKLSDISLSLPGISYKQVQTDWSICSCNAATGDGVSYGISSPFQDLAPIDHGSNEQVYSAAPVFLERIVETHDQANSVIDYLARLGFSSYLTPARGGYKIKTGPVNQLNPDSPSLRALLDLGFE